MKLFKQIAPLLAFILIIAVLLGGVVYATTWQYKYPIIITDTSNTTRTNTPVMLGFGGQNLINAGKINVSGNDTNLQIGTTSIKYMMSTTNVTAVIPSLPSGGKAMVDIYTGYSPAQTSFPIITGGTGASGGNITTASSTNLDLVNSGNITWNGWFDPTSSGYLLNKSGAINVKGNGAGILTTTIGAIGTIYPSVSTNSSGFSALNPTSYNVTMPTGYSNGDLIIVTLTAYQNITAVIAPPAGWTQLYLYNGGGLNTIYGAWYKIATGAETSNQLWTSSVAVYWSYAAVRIATNTYAGVPVCGVTANNTSSAPDPPSLTSGFGAVYTLWLAHVYSNVDQATPPTAYTMVAHAGAGGYYNPLAIIQKVVATENPGAFGDAANWLANTIAVEGGGLTIVSTPAISAAEHTISTYVNGIVSGIIVDGSFYTTAFTGSVPVNTNNLIWNTANIMPYCNYIKLVKSGIEKLWYQPNTIIIGSNLIDRDVTQNGTIAWGVNSGITITYGAMVSFASTAASSNETGGFTMPASPMPSTWFAAGEHLTSLPLYDFINSMATSAGIPTLTIYILFIIGLAFLAFFAIVMFTKSAFMAVLAMCVVLFIGSSMTIVPMWLPFVIMVVDFGIMYLYRQIAY